MELLHESPPEVPDWVNQGHPRLFWGPVALFLIAELACGHQVTWVIASPATLGHYVVNGGGSVPLWTTILANMLIPLQDTSEPPTNYDLGVLDGLSIGVYDDLEAVEVRQLIKGQPRPVSDIQNFGSLRYEGLDCMPSAHDHHGDEVPVNSDDLIGHPLFSLFVFLH